MEKKFIDESIKENNVNIDLNNNERESKEIILNFNKYNPSELKQEIDEQINMDNQKQEDNKENKDRKSKRNYGIDLLRIISMYLICIMHVFYGSILYTVELKSTNYFLVWFLETTSYCATDCYALISGYVGVSSKYRYANIVYLWLQVEFHSLGILFISAIIKREMFTLGEFYDQVLPITNERYWYFSSYFGLFLVIPYLNYSLNNIPKNIAKWNLILGIIIITTFSRLNSNFIYLSNGYSSFWLIILYIVGGYIKKFEPFKNIKKLYLILIWIFCIIISWIVKISIEVYKEEDSTGDLFISYLSITILIVAVIMLELFSRINFNKKPKIIEILASTSFGVYIVHTHTVIANWCNKRFTPFNDYNPILFVLATIGTSLTMYVASTIIDYLRYRLFELIKLRKFLLKMEEKFNKKFIDVEI